MHCINTSFFSLWQMHPPKSPYLLTVITHHMCLNVVAFLFVPLIHTVAFAADMKSKVWCKGLRSINVVLWIVNWHVSKYRLPKNICFSTVVLNHSRWICCLLSRITSLSYVDQQSDLWLAANGFMFVCRSWTTAGGPCSSWLKTEATCWVVLMKCRGSTGTYMPLIAQIKTICHSYVLVILIWATWSAEKFS